jgi:hypothetical protein
MANITKCVVDYNQGQGNIGKTYEVCLSYVPEKENPRFADKENVQENPFQIKSNWEQDFKVLNSKERPVEEYIVFKDEEKRETAYRYQGGEPIIVKERNKVFFGQFVDAYDERKKTYGHTQYLSVTWPVRKSARGYRIGYDIARDIKGWLVIKPPLEEFQRIKDKYKYSSEVTVDERGWLFIPAVEEKPIKMDADDWRDTNPGYREYYEYKPLEVYTPQDFQKILGLEIEGKQNEIDDAVSNIKAKYAGKEALLKAIISVIPKK